jgi:hypothetical protein
MCSQFAKRKKERKERKVMEHFLKMPSLLRNV